MITPLLDINQFFAPIDKYIGALFSDPSFSVLLALISFWYSYYLFIKQRKDGQILALTRSNWTVDFPRRTYLVIYNAADKDLTASSFLENHPLTITPAGNLKIYSIRMIYCGSRDGMVSLSSLSNSYVLKFDIFRKKAAVVIEIFHNSEKFVDSAWRDFEITGIFPDIMIERDDFSDHMMQRAESVYPFTVISFIILGILFTYFISIFAKPFTARIPYTYIMIGCMMLSFYLTSTYLLARVGNDWYQLQGKILAAAFKAEGAPDLHFIEQKKSIYFLSEIVINNGAHGLRYESGFESQLRFLDSQVEITCAHVMVGKAHALGGDKLYIRSMVKDADFDHALLSKGQDIELLQQNLVIATGVVEDVKPEYVKGSWKTLFKGA